MLKAQKSKVQDPKAKATVSAHYSFQSSRKTHCSKPQKNPSQRESGLLEDLRARCAVVGSGAEWAPRRQVKFSGASNLKGSRVATRILRATFAEIRGMNLRNDHVRVLPSPMPSCPQLPLNYFFQTFVQCSVQNLFRQICLSWLVAQLWGHCGLELPFAPAQFCSVLGVGHLEHLEVSYLQVQNCPLKSPKAPSPKLNPPRLDVNAAIAKDLESGPCTGDRCCGQHQGAERVLERCGST